MQPPAGPVLDASALLAYLRDEPGGSIVDAALVAGAVINVVNYAEVLARLAANGQDPASADRGMRDSGLTGDLLQVVPVTQDDAIVIARLRVSTRSLGLSLGDRCCLATGLRMGRPILTSDRAWAQLTIGASIQLIRP